MDAASEGTGRARSLLTVAIEAIDAVNARDPGRISFHGRAWPVALLEGQRASAWLDALHVEASDALAVAARAHHLRRWEIERASYPRTRYGYLAWRAGLYEFHGWAVSGLARECGLPNGVGARASELMRKQSIKTDPEAQAYEDAVSLAFLEVRLTSFLDQVTDEQAIRAIRRTWAKISPAARELAGAIPLDYRSELVVSRALEK